MKTEVNSILAIPAEIQTKLDRIAFLDKLLLVNEFAFDDAFGIEIRSLHEELVTIFLPIVRTLVAAGLLTCCIDVEKVESIEQYVSIIGDPKLVGDKCKYLDSIGVVRRFQERLHNQSGWRRVGCRGNKLSTKKKSSFATDEQVEDFVCESGHVFVGTSEYTDCPLCIQRKYDLTNYETVIAMQYVIRAEIPMTPRQIANHLNIPFEPVVDAVAKLRLLAYFKTPRRNDEQP
jgi:hypothetical protein